MSTDLQDLLREGLDQLTAGASVPGGLVGRAQQHNRQRKIRIRAVIAASTVLAAAAVTVSLAAGQSGPGSAPVRTQTIADAATRTEQALAAAVDHGKAIQVTRMSGRNMPFGLITLGPQGALGNPSPTQRLPGARRGHRAAPGVVDISRSAPAGRLLRRGPTGLRQCRWPHQTALR
jgi:hypothetical protein